MDISQLTGYASNTTQAAADNSKLSADMDMFLKLLVAQLKTQVPGDEMDVNKFTEQLVQYSNVEQSIKMNTKMDNIMSLSVANLGAQAVSYIGKVAQVIGDVMPLEGGKAKATYTLDKNVSSAMVTVKDMEGKVVYSEEGKNVSGTHEFVWDGKDKNGQVLEDGAYQIVVTTNATSGETAATVVTTVFGKVTGVASDGTGVYVGLGDAVTASLGDILTIRNDDFFDKGDTPVVPETPEEPEALAAALASRIFS